MDYPLLEVIWSMIVFFAWILWIWLLIVVYTDMFRRRDIGAWGKTGWVLLTLFLPFVGVFAYLVTQGRGMGERAEEQARRHQAAVDDHIRSVAAGSAGSTAGGPAGGSNGVDELTRAKQLLDSGALTQSEFEQMKRKVLV
ncbi:SHOCT domain-containing protein [Geodermatophilus sp. SYSU D00758]